MMRLSRRKQLNKGYRGDKTLRNINLPFIESGTWKHSLNKIVNNFLKDFLMRAVARMCRNNSKDKG